MGLLLMVAPAAGDEPATTVLADFEGPSVAARITEVRDGLAGDCDVERVLIPARGQGSLAVHIGATARGMSVTCDLTFREPVRFRQANRVATFCWINEGEIELAFRVHDADGQLFETPLQPVRLPHRWVGVGAALAADGLRRVRGAAPPTYPLEIQGYRIVTQRLGKQTVYLDDLEVEHRVGPEELVRGGFEFDESTRIYEPGATVGAAVLLENRSRRLPLSVVVDLAWTRLSGSVLQRQQATVSLPASGTDFRSRRRLDFSQRITEPGLYRLVAQARAPGWTFPNTLETTIAVTPSNRRVSRGRSTFFGVRSNLLREPELDQMLEISVARDLGVNLLALDAPWRLLEPKAGAYDFDALEPLVAALTQKDVAALVVVTQPPDWLPADDDARLDRFNQLVTAACRRFGERVVRYQIGDDVLGPPSRRPSLDAFAVVRAAIRERHPKVELLPPPIPVTDAAPSAELAAFIREHPDFPLVFRTEGESPTSLRQLESLRARGGFTWQPSHLWLHEAEARVGAGHDVDAEQLLRHYVAAAAAGVGGLLWFDLRDDDNDPANPAALRGLVRRDFSPKTALLGYAAVAGMLTGYRYAGPLRGTPESFDGALFIGANRQVAALLPRPNRILPAVIFPTIGAPGELAAQDFERRSLPALTEAGTVFPTVPRPLFLTLTLKAPQSEPQLALAQPWLRVPQTVFFSPGETFTIEVDALRPWGQSYLQLRLPKDSPLRSSLSAMSLQGNVGETVRARVELSSDTPIGREEISLRVSLDGDNLDIPLVARRLTDIRPLAAGQPLIGPAHHVGDLTAVQGRPTAKATLYVAHDSESIHIGVVVDDDRFVPLRLDRKRRPTGDQLLVGLAAEGAWHAVQARLDPAARPLKPQPLHGTRADLLDEWQCTPVASEGGDVMFRLRIPARSIIDGNLVGGQRLLLAVCYVDDDADGFPPIPLSWGEGLEQVPATTGYRWIRLVGDTAP